MLVWLVTVGEPLPIDGAGERLHRAGILANLLVKKGHQVVWWSSTFDHARKRLRFTEDKFIKAADNFRIILLHSVTYRKNISIKRIINHYCIARKFSSLAVKEDKPDIILSSYPTIELSKAAVDYAWDRNIPVVIDIRDLWPDEFLEVVPNRIRWMGKLVLYPMYRAARKACAGSSAITGITPAFVDWGLKFAGRDRTALDRDFPMGYSDKAPDPGTVKEDEAFWQSCGLTQSGKDFIICFFGTIGRQFELDTVIRAARDLKSQHRPFKFVLCGAGDNLEYYKTLARDCPNILFPGWVGKSQIWTLMRMSALGLAPYRSGKSFVQSIPNKPVEYLSAGLPVVSSLKGILHDLLRKNKCGLTYENGSHQELSSVIIKLHDNRDQLKQMSKNALRLYEEHFVAEKVYGEMIDYLEMVARGNKETG